ncbi:MAG: hypothetical protein U9P73_01175 [Candidatus Cloacimonadota bacterium]|nr:hypothetical protein [Candidatus Cloacimonadota bacterium]
MEITKFLLSIAILGLAINMSASVRINGLGSYFEYLIPDTETDIELFPSYLIELESKYVQIINNANYNYYNGIYGRNIDLSLMPIAKKLFFRINANVISDDSEPRIYLNDSYNRNSTVFDGREYGAALVSNSLSYELADSFHLGCFFKYGVNWKELDDERLEIEDSDLIIHEDMDDIDYNSDFLSTGINIKFISNLKTDISLIYSKSDIEDFDIHIHDYERIYSEFDESSRSIDENLENIIMETKDMGISILLEAANDEIVNRYFFESHYIQQSTEYLGERNSQRLYYDDGELDREYEHIFENDKMEDMEIYSVILGFGKTITKEKWDIFFGAKLYGMYGKTMRDESYYSFDYYQNIDPDTTYTDSTITNGVNNFEIKDWKAALEVPFGVSYKLNGVVQLFGGMGLKLIRQELEYFEDNEFSRWETDRYIAFGTTITPFECLKIDVNFGRDFAYFSTWQIDLKYLW